MTIGLLIQSNEDAVLLCDRRINSEDGIISNRFMKHFDYQSSRFSFRVVGAGDVTAVRDFYANMEKQKFRSLQDAVEKMSQTLRKLENGRIKQWREEELHKIRKSAKSLSRRQRKEFIEENAERIAEAEREHRGEANCRYIFVGKGAKDKPLAVNFVESSYARIRNDVHAIGSKEHALAYVYAQNKDIKKASLDELLFLASNAYQQSTVHFAIGGTPEITTFGKLNKTFSHHEAAVLTNVAGAYSAHLMDEKYMYASIKALIKGRLDEASRPLQQLGESTSASASATLPLYIWQERKVQWKELLKVSY